MAINSSALNDQKVVKALDELTKDFSKEDIEILKEIMAQNTGSEMELLVSLMNYTYQSKPVPVREFVEDKQFLGLKGQVYPVLLNDLEEMFSGDYDEAVFAGAIGFGKSTVAEISMTRMAYEVSCFKNPQKALGLMDGSVIAFINVSINKDSAKKIVFQGIKSKMENSPYFREQFPIVNSKAEELRLANNVWIFPVASGEQGILGYNVLGGVMDEVNFLDYIENSARATDGGIYDQAESLRTQLIRRMKSRYMHRGKLPGILLQVSSAAYPDDYTERRIEEAQENPKIFWRRYSQWDTPPADKYCGQTFQLSLGDLTTRPQILTCEEELADSKEKGLEIIDVPIEYKFDFEKDIDSSIRDLAGRPTLSIHPFILYREKVSEAMERGPKELGLEHPFGKEVTTLQDGATLNPDKLLIPRYKKLYENADETNKDYYKKLYNNLKQKPRYIHIDLAKTSMAGFSMGHVHEYVEVTKRNEEGEEYIQKMPVIVIELMLRIVAPQHGEIQVAHVRSLVHELRSYGYRLNKVTLDQFQSLDTQQQLIQKGIDAGELSVDRKPDAYNAYKDALYEDRILMYWYEPAYWETIRLEKNEKTGKIDHPANKSGSKDVSDAIAGVCHHCVEFGPHAPSLPPRFGNLEGGRRGNPNIYTKERNPIVSTHRKNNLINDTLADPYGEDGEDFSWLLK